MTNQVTPEAAVEIVERHLRFYTDRPGTDWTVEATAILEAAAPILLSHEREETRLAHLDAVVNAATVSKYEAAVDAIYALMADPEHYDSQGPSDGYVSVENLRATLAHILTVT